MNPTTAFALLWMLAFRGTPAQAPHADAAVRYLASQTERIAQAALSEVRSAEDWKARRGEYRRQLLEMLGLWPLPDRSDLRATVTGRVERPKFVVEKLHFQSMPGLYVTANLYLPRELQAPAPAILYLCGHSRVFKDGVAYGNKANYQHHPAWFAENGYVALIIDTLDLGEIEGEHHGTYRRGFWWWPSRGYTPAGVETWNAMRALDYLESRSEVDRARIGVTGRSGGGAYTWFLAGVDDRPAVLVPVAGIADMRSHVVDRAIEGHCDCMYMQNTYAWDFSILAALAAPRPLLVANSDKDRIFPLDGVLRIHGQLKRMYDLHGAADRLGLFISEGPHSDTQELQVAAFRWMNRWLRKETATVLPPSYSRFEPADLKVFETLPPGQINTKIDGRFVPAATQRLPGTRAEWDRMAAEMKAAMIEKVFRNLTPPGDPPLEFHPTRPLTKTARGMDITIFTSRIGVSSPSADSLVMGPKSDSLVVRLLEPKGISSRMRAAVLEEKAIPAVELAAFLYSDEIGRGTAVALVFPRGSGAFSGDGLEAVHNRRRLLLLGQSLESLQVADVRSALHAFRTMQEVKDLPITLEGEGELAAVALFAAILEPSVARLRLVRPPASLAGGGSYPNLLRTMDLPQALALVLPRPVEILESDPALWAWPMAVAKLTGGEIRVAK